jgi:hypothetical protein
MRLTLGSAQETGHNLTRHLPTPWNNAPVLIAGASKLSAWRWCAM